MITHRQKQEKMYSLQILKIVKELDGQNIEDLVSRLK